MTRRLQITLIALATMGTGVFIGRIAWPSSCPDPMKKQFCALTRMSIQRDRWDFESGDIKLQEAALERFYNGGRLYHGAQSMMYCMDQLPDLPLGCWLYKDWKCLAGVALEIEQALERWRGR